MNSFLKMLVYRIPRLRELREEVEFLKEENSRLIKGIDAERGSNNFLNFRKEELDRLHEEVVERNWGILPSRKHLFCFSPFKRIEILTNGDVYTCCSAHLKHGYFIGNLFEEEVEEIWNSEKAKKLRYSVSEGDFEYCNHMCRWLHQDKEDRNDSISPVREREEVAVHYKNYQECSLQEGPVEISLSCDDTCNLYCQSCRAKRKVLDKEGSEKLYQILMTKVRPMLVTCKNLSALGSGDIFSSQALSRFYQTLSKEEFPDLELLIITNAQLLTKEKWEEFSNLHGMTIDLVISIDAAKKETYEVIRRGGSWEVLNQNMDAIGEWRRQKQIRSLQINFLVQRKNYLEMEEFLLLGKKWGADRIEFQKMANWGSYTDEEFQKEDVNDPKNEYYQEAMKRLSKICGQDNGIEIIQNII
ncbi:MAG: SPASM domain-containing protein [Lachnospiraceae bacterium]|nr:SPASM domain-containing protein [Lachnospiraceae bacterium]